MAQKKGEEVDRHHDPTVAQWMPMNSCAWCTQDQAETYNSTASKYDVNLNPQRRRNTNFTPKIHDASLKDNNDHVCDSFIILYLEAELFEKFTINLDFIPIRNPNSNDNDDDNLLYIALLQKTLSIYLR